MINRISRRRALAGIGGAVAALGLSPQPAFAADLPVVRVSVVPIFAVAPQFAAQAQGYFAAEGISVTTQPIQGGSVGIPGLASGSFDILYSNSISVLTALERGIDIRLIAEATPVTEKPPDVGALLTRKDDPIRNGKEAEGRTLGINAKFDIQWLVMQGWVKKTGGDLDKITYREVPLPSMVDALRSKQVDAALVLDPFKTVGLSDPNIELSAWPLSTTMPGLPSSLWITSGQAAESKPEIIRAYLRAFMKGTAWVDEHLGDDAYIQLVAGYTRTDPKLLAKMVLGPEPMDINVDAMRRLVVLMKEYGLLKTDVDFQSKIFR